MAMEGVLKCLVRDAQALGRGYLHIKQLSQGALELLETQTGLLQSTPHELREKCFAALHAALVSNSGHLLKLALLGVQKMLRDNHFISKNCDPPDDRHWLLPQLLNCLAFPNWSKVSEEVQIEICKIFISFACLDPKYLNLNAHVMVDLLTRCLDMGLTGGVRSKKHQSSLQTCAAQNLQAFSKHISGCLGGQGEVNQVIPIVQFLCDKMEDGLTTSQSFPVEFSLEAILAVLGNLSDDSALNSRSHNFVWRTLCPTLLQLIGVPLPNGHIVDCRIAEIRCVASIGCELLRLFGNVALLRAPLESLFHRLLVINNVTTRLEILRMIKEVVSTSQRLLIIGGPFLAEMPVDATPQPNEFGILRILFDALEESAQQQESLELRFLALECANVMLSSLLCLTGTPSERHMSNVFMEKINALYPDLDSCDYIGSMSYPTRLRMPKTYEQLLRDQRQPVAKTCHTVDIDRLMINEETVEINSDDASSCASGVTEGPETDGPDVESTDQDQESVIRLFGNGADNTNRSSIVDLERLAARKFLRDLQSFLPRLNCHRSPIEVDMAIQQFASDYCEESLQGHVIYNADGIYLATYVTLLFNYELAKKGYYPSRTGVIAQSEEDFVDSVLNSGILVYLSPDFMAELYQCVLVTDVMGDAGFNANAENTSLLSNCAFINLLTDVRQVKSAEQSSCFLSDCRKLHFAFTPQFLLREPRRQAGLKFSRRLLTCFWDSFLFIYSNGVAPATCQMDSRAISLTLEGLPNAAKLANILGLQDRSGTIFSLLASVACGNPNMGNTTVSGRQRSNKNRLTKARLMGILSKPVLDVELPHILSLDVVLNKGLELASYNKEAWTHILRCCLYVTELERRVYQSKQSDRLKMTAQLKNYTAKLKWKLALSKDQQGNDDLNLSSATFGGLEDESSTDSYNFLTAASQLPANDNDIQQLLEKATKADSYRNTGQLDDKLVARIVGLLSDRVELLLEDAASKLNLKSLLLLIEELCQLCHVQLHHLDEDNISSQCHWVLHRIGEVMLRSVKTGRPLYHALHCWAIVGPTLLKAACSGDSTVAKTSVEILRSIISHVLQEQPEPRHFHFNEALFKPFEHLLCREYCDSDLQDQVMSSLCELVECWSPEIRSGWRPLFACLRRWPPPAQEPTDTCSSSQRIHLENISTVKEVLAAFVQQSGSCPLIFVNAAMDAILCQLHYLKCYRYVAELSDVALGYLQQFSKMLAQLCPPSGQQTPVFYSAMGLTFLPNECDFEPLLTMAVESREQIDNEAHWNVLLDLHRPGVVLQQLWDHPTGLYKVFYLLVDGVTCCLTHSRDPVQKSIGEVVHATLTFLIDSQVELLAEIRFWFSFEYEFALLCLRCSILPGMSHWLNLLIASSDDDMLIAGKRSFKQMCGLVCEIVSQILMAEEARQLAGPAELTSLFREVVLLYVECAVQDNECLIRIGNSCFRHLILNCGDAFDAVSPKLWEVAASALCLIVRCSLSAVQRLIRDDRVAESHPSQKQPSRFRHLSQQVFNQDASDSISPDSSCNALVALLSYQLAVNTTANIVCCSNTALSGRDKALNLALFAENTQQCARVTPTTLSTLCGVLRTGCEFGIDFEMALGVRRHLQKLFGFARPPSLSRVTALSSDLLVVALTNLALHSDRHLRELEQWIDFLIYFYFQESGSGLILPEALEPSTIAHHIIKTDDDDDDDDDDKATDPDVRVGSENPQRDASDASEDDDEEGAAAAAATTAAADDKVDIVLDDAPVMNVGASEEGDLLAKPERDLSVSTSRGSSGSTESLVKDKETAEQDKDEGQLFSEQMAAALESYRQRKRLKPRAAITEPNSPRKEQNGAQPGIISKQLLMSALLLLSQVDRRSQSSFHIVWSLLTRIRLHCTDRQLRQAHEDFEKHFPSPDAS